MSTTKKKNIILVILGTILSILWLSPFYLMLANSFKTKKEIFESPIKMPGGLHLENYTQAADNLSFVQTFTNSILIPLVSFFGKLGMLNRPGIVFLYLGFGSSMAIFLYHGTITGIPKSLDEAAIIDGCNRFQVFWYIIFPILKPITVTVAILNTIWIWNDYLLPSLVINKIGSETIPLKMFFFFGEYTKQWHLALAGLTLAIIPVIVFYFFAQKHIIKGVTAGSVK